VDQAPQPHVGEPVERAGGLVGSGVSDLGRLQQGSSDVGRTGDGRPGRHHHEVAVLLPLGRLPAQRLGERDQGGLRAGPVGQRQQDSDRRVVHDPDEGEPADRARRDRAGLGRILLRLTEIGTDHADRGDLCIRPAIDAFSIADFGAFDRLVDIGYEAAMEALPAWREESVSGSS